ncbi:hypothetical protein [Natronomonas sp. EA1]|uniref:hypothetical protein n=1 Tax=Natronomonas sp. EA1 TaxID=3421655 RepID=UPI003EB8F5B4
MVTLVGAVGLLVILAVNSLVAALLTRVFRVRLETRWGSVIYAVLIIPVVLVMLTLVLSGIVGLGFDLGDPATVMGIAVLLPLALGMSFDYFWQPAPEDVELPAKYQ